MLALRRGTGVRDPSNFNVLDSQFAEFFWFDGLEIQCSYPSCPHVQSELSGWTLVSALEEWNDHVRRYHK